MSDERQDDKTGYKRPPKSTQFKKGRSGNPKGRPKGARNFKTVVQETLDQPVTLREGERVRNVSSREAAMIQLRGKALKGDQRALERLLALAERHDFEQAADEAESQLHQDDQQIIERFKERNIQEHEARERSDQEGEDQEQGQ
jgi:hypothetical protein